MKINRLNKHTAGMRSSLFSLLCLLTLSAGLTTAVGANVSRTLPSSLTHISSGFYHWSAWDYVTFPYIYGQQDQDIISSIVTPTITEGKYALGGRATLGYPIYWAIAFKNQSTRIDATLPDDANIDNNPETTVLDQFVEAINRDITIMLGTHLGFLGLKSIGIGVYAEFGEFLANRQQPGASPIEGDQPNNEFPNDKSLLRGLTIGVEFGQFVALGEGVGNPSNSWAWTMSLDYRSLGSRFLDANREVSSPRLDTYKLGDAFKKDNRYDKNSSGKTREEINIGFLGWYPLGPIGQIGLEADGLLPFGTGTERTQGDDGQIIEEEAKLTGYQFNGSLFYSFDFALDKLGSVFRIQPLANFFIRSENVENSTGTSLAGRDVSFYEPAFNLGLNFSLSLFLTETKDLFLLIGWRPLVVMYHVYEERYREGQEAGQPVPQEITSKITDRAGKVILENHFVGVGYNFNENLSIYLKFGTAEEGYIPNIVSPTIGENETDELENVRLVNRDDEEELFLDITKISFGIDYQFGK